MDARVYRIIPFASILALVLSSILVPNLRATSPESPDILVQVLGGTADLAALKACEEAELYLHAGYRGKCPDKEGHHHDEGHAHESDGVAQSDLPFADVVHYLYGETAPKVHRHLVGEEEKEILPWLVTAVRLNPRMIDAWRNGTYWYYRTGEPGKAEQFINEGIRHNPRCYQLYLERGILYHRLGKWDRSVASLERALDLWRDDNPDAQWELEVIYRYLRDSQKHASTVSNR